MNQAGWWLVALCSGALAGCGNLRSLSSPDVIYDSDAESARYLQIPPDLTDIRNAEQFILPGTTGAPVTRNTLLPQFNSVTFERAGGQSWLSFDQTAETLWPVLIGFLRSEKYLIDQTLPTAGTISTQWRPASSVAKSGLLDSFIGEGEAFSRVSFRLERNGSGSRLFSRSQLASESDIKQAAGQQGDWPSRSHDPEKTSALLTRLLTYIGLEEQKARGILDDKQARAIIGNATIETTGSGSQLMIYRGFQPSFKAVLLALENLDLPVSSADDGVGRIEVVKSDTRLVLELKPIHFSEVQLAVTDVNGQRLSSEEEQAVLSSLLDYLA